MLHCNREQNTTATECQHLNQHTGSTTTDHTLSGTHAINQAQY